VRPNKTGERGHGKVTSPPKKKEQLDGWKAQKKGGEILKKRRSKRGVGSNRRKMGERALTNPCTRKKTSLRWQLVDGHRWKGESLKGEGSR